MSDQSCAAERPEVSPTPELVVITGMSGAGRSEATHTFEDLGFFCIDNLPPSFIPQLVELAHLPGSNMSRLALVSDVRAHEYFAELAGQLRALAERGVDVRVLFLEADDETLLRRFKETRRRHPLCEDGEPVLDSIRAERTELQAIKAMADVTLDTSGLKPQELRVAIRERFAAGSENVLAITVMSFGFKYGMPSEADLIMDVRFLPNPHYEPALRPLSGKDEPVREYVMAREETASFLRAWHALLDVAVPGYVREGKQHLTIGLGCTGGMHRSVALAEETAEYLRSRGFTVAVSHRDLGRDSEQR